MDSDSPEDCTMPSCPAVTGAVRTALALVALDASGICHADCAPAQTPVGQPQAVVLGAHTLYWQGEGAGSSPAVTAPIETQATGSSLIVFNAGYASNSLAPTDTYENAWSALGSAVVYEGYDGAFDVKAYVALAGRGGSGHSVSIVKNGQASGEITMPFIEVRNAGVLQAVAQNYPSANATITSGNVTTTGPATLIAVWWGDAFVLDMTAVPDQGFVRIDCLLHLPPNSAVQSAVAYRQVSVAGTYNVTWSQSPAQGAPLWLFAFQSGDGDVIFANGFE